MTILNEMRAFLDGQIKERANGNKSRDIDLICYYYGFGDSELPTLEETAQRYSGFASRERARQILNKYFRHRATSGDLPSAALLQELLQSRLFWSSSSLDDAVAEARIAGESFSVIGLLRLLDDLQIQHFYATYSLGLQEDAGTTGEYLLLQVDAVPRLRALLQRARAFPGLKGVARFEDLESTHEDFESHKDLMLDIIRRHPDTWVSQRTDGLWYLFEDRDNSLVNSGRKALTAFPECDSSRLAQSLHDALRRRRHRYAYPSVDLIEDYLRTSRHFAVDEGSIRRPPSFKPVRLNDIEEDLIQYLGTQQDVLFTAAKAFLEGKAHTKYNIDQALTMSPLVFVDRTLGRGHHTYHTVEPLESSHGEKPSTENRYSEFRDRLHELRDTDSSSEQSSRREQHILSQWLFDGKDTETCALCGQVFSVEALVTAHKKRRADCNEGERRDPHIVMPLCLFGCDYLYEQKHIFVHNGMVERGVPPKLDGGEREHLDKLVGRQFESRWLEGQSTYFHHPTS